MSSIRYTEEFKRDEQKEKNKKRTAKLKKSIAENDAEQREINRKRLAKLKKSLAENDAKMAEKATGSMLNEQIEEADERLKMIKQRRKDRLKKSLAQDHSINDKLNIGIEVSIGEINFKHGLAIYQGRQVVVYKKEQDSSRISEALQNVGKVGRFHVTCCETIQRMKTKVRYCVTNNHSGMFHITGTDWKSGEFMEGKINLSVCRNCLSALNYKNYNNSQYDIRGIISDEFLIKDFFSTSEHMPKKA